MASERKSNSGPLDAKDIGEELRIASVDADTVHVDGPSEMMNKLDVKSDE